MSSRHSLVSTPGVGSPSRFKSNVLNALQGPYCGGKLAPAACSVTPKTRPVPLKIWLYSTIWGQKGGGKRRSAEKSKSGTFPLRLEIPQPQRDFHFFHRPGY